MAGPAALDNVLSQIPCRRTATPPRAVLLRAASRRGGFLRSASECEIRSLPTVAFRDCCGSEGRRSGLPGVEALSFGFSTQGGESRDDLIRFLPFAFFRRQFLFARFRDAIELRFTIVVRDTPLRRDRTLLLQLQQHRIKSSLIDRQHIAACLLDPLRNAVTMLR